MRILYMASVLFILAFYTGCKENSSAPESNNNNPEITPGDTVIVNGGISTDGSDTIRSVSLSRLPLTYTRFSETFMSAGKTPEGSAALFLEALIVYNKYQQEGYKCFVNVLSEDLKTKSSSKESFEGYIITKFYFDSIKDGLAAHPAIITAFIKGAEPENGYKPEGPPFKYEFTTNQWSGQETSGSIKLFIISKASDSYKPIELVKENDGMWRVSNFSSVMTGIIE